MNDSEKKLIGDFAGKGNVDLQANTANKKMQNEVSSPVPQKEDWEEEFCAEYSNATTEMYYSEGIEHMMEFVRQTRLSAQLEAIDRIKEQLKDVDAHNQVVYWEDIERIRKDIISDSK